MSDEPLNEKKEQRSNPNMWDAAKELWGWYRSENGKRFEQTLFGIFNLFRPLPSARTFWDIIIVGGCLFAVIYAGQLKLVDGCAVQSLMSLIIGAVVGSRFNA